MCKTTAPADHIPDSFLTRIHVNFYGARAFAPGASPWLKALKLSSAKDFQLPKEPAQQAECPPPSLLLPISTIPYYLVNACIDEDACDER